MIAEELSKTLAATFLKNGNYEALGASFGEKDTSFLVQPAAISALNGYTKCY